ncbi:MAG: hypothetical protein IJR88_05480 [Clostridia bacterium]|nr:hypothetical protein [Clostridia bacterium]
MTERKKPTVTPGRLFFGLALFFLHALFLRNHEVAAGAVWEGLSLAAKNVVPSLFPFLVLSSILVQGGYDSLLFAPFAKKFFWNPSVFSAVLLGLLCGAPVGASYIAETVRAGRLSKRDAERLLPLVSCPSLPFVVGIVGGAFLGDTRLGWLLFFSTLPGLLLAAILLTRRKEKERIPFAPPLQAPQKLSSLLGGGIVSAVKSVLLVSAYIVFFSALFETLSYCFSALSIPLALSAFFYCALELSGGVAEASALAPALALPLCGFAVGFSGLSFYFQVLTLTDKADLSPKFYLPVKLLQGVLAAILFSLFYSLV